MDPRTQCTLEHLAERWRGVDTAALAPGFALLAAGTPASAREIARAGGIPEPRVRNALRSDRVGKDSDGRLVELFGVSIPPAAYRARLDGRELSTCCALVAHMLPSLVGRVVAISGQDPETKERMRLRVGTIGVEDMAPRTLVATLVESDAKDLLENASESFCRHVRYFASAASAQRFVGADARRRVVAVAELDTMGRALYRAVWAHKTRPLAV